jgi:hypothetical protein
MRLSCLGNCRLRAFILFIFLLLVASNSAFAAKGTSDSRLPDVLVWVDARGAGGQFVSITYPSVIKKAQAEEHLRRLTAATGWTVENVRITDDSVEASGENPMTSVEFATPQAVKIDSPALPVEPIVTALKDVKSMEILFMLPPSFRFRVLGDYENKYIRIVRRQGISTYTYDITVKDSSFESLDLPVPKQDSEAAGNTRGKLGILIVALAIVLAAMTAILAYSITGKLTGKNEPPPN